MITHDDRVAEIKRHGDGVDLKRELSPKTDVIDA